ncbi:MAG: MraY family glycosyltransferase [Clostridia bacterium]|nr:MraY family glycosyltransferase [Clostridia bacterium]
MAFVYSIVGVTFVICLILTPVVIKLCRKYNIVDIPKDSRRVHSKPMPRIGGVAIVISMLIGFLIYYLLTKDIPSIALNEKFLGYIIGGLIIAIMGLIDDLFNLRARYKFLFQLAAGLVVYYFGIRISGVKIPFLFPDVIDFVWWLDLPLTLLWVIGVTNAINLIDGLDGLAAGITAISATSLLIIFIATSASLEAIIISAVLVGAVLGFLPYNFNPAKTFMGDVSANFLGFTMAVVSILGFAKGYTMLAIIAPVLVLGIPIFDTIFAMVRRFLKGQPMLKPDGGHIHHRLIRRGFSQKQAVILLYIITTIFCMLAVLLVSADVWKLVLLILAFVCFSVFGIITTLHRKNDKNDKTEEINENFEAGAEHKINEEGKNKV